MLVCGTNILFSTLSYLININRLSSAGTLQ
jgi:hypothetical protein